jgi:hypothetical protein
MNRLWLGSAMIAAALGCSTPTSSDCNVGEDVVPGGIFGYQASGPDGAVLVVGVLQFAPATTPPYTGTWEFDWQQGADTTAVVGPQIGSGSFTATVDGARLMIQLNPQNADNNVGLVGCYNRTRMTGAWSFTTITGERARGAFTLSALLD